MAMVETAPTRNEPIARTAMTHGATACIHTPVGCLKKSSNRDGSKWPSPTVIAITAMSRHSTTISITPSTRASRMAMKNSFQV